MRPNVYLGSGQDFNNFCNQYTEGYTTLQYFGTMASKGRGKWKPQAGFGGGYGAEAQSSKVPYALIKNARQSGQLNLSNRNLMEIPIEVWRINVDVPEEGKSVSLDTGDGDRWWEQVDLKKLILASNKLKELSPDIKNLPALNVLDVHDNQLESLPDEIGELKELSRINLSHNNLSSIPQSVTRLQSAKVLLLNGNKIGILPEEFGNLVHIEDLNLEENSLTMLPESFGNLSKLMKLNLSHNQLESIPGSFERLSALTDLNLRSNKLKIMPQGLHGMTSLDILDCRANLISEFPRISGSLNIKELYLSNNRIRRLDRDMFAHLPSLVTLDLKDNTIESVPEEITLCAKLERLDLTNNCISTLPFSMGNMKNIKSISLEGNALRGLRRDIVSKGTQAVLKYLKSRLPSNDEQESVELKSSGESKAEINDNFLSFGSSIDTHAIMTSKKITFCNKKATSVPVGYFVENVAISLINLSKNLLEVVPADRIVSYSNSLVELDLSCNKLTSLPTAFSCLARLNFINISNNVISDLCPQFKAWQSLRQIAFAGNRFTAVPTFLYEIQSVEVIIANSNQITEINVAGLAKLPKLTNLDLSNNNIFNVPPELGNISTLRSLLLEGNSFRNPRHAILMRGTAYLLDYLKDRIPH